MDLKTSRLMDIESLREEVKKGGFVPLYHVLEKENYKRT